MELYLDVAGRELRDPHTGDIARDLKKIADTVVDLQTRTVAGAAFIGLIAEAQVSPQTRTAFLAEFAERRREMTRKVLRRACCPGAERPCPLNTEAVVACDGGHYRGATSKEPRS